MNIEIGMGVLGANDSSWGSTSDGAPVFLLRTPQAAIRIVFTPEEAKEHGMAAIYLAMHAALARKAPSPLVGVDGGPLQCKFDFEATYEPADLSGRQA